MSKITLVDLLERSQLTLQEQTELDKKVMAAVEAAMPAFWAAVAKALPECKSGDMSPHDQHNIEMAMEKAVYQWYMANRPGRPSRK